jgi:hypothetical protein
MKAPTFTVLSTYRYMQTANDDALKQGLNPDEAVFMCENGMHGFEIRIYDDWQQWQPDLYIKN